MQLRMWMLDVAREQSPTLDHLRRYLDLTQESGYNAIGLYLEHRFAYPSTPWSHGQGCITPEMVLTLQKEYPQVQIVPFINLLGHFEGMLYTEYGKRFREETLKGLQACPCSPGFTELCQQIIEDTVAVFNSNLIHIGGDETQQLGLCPVCKAKVESAGSADGKAVLYGDHFGPLAQKVKGLGRRPAVWGDMFLEHPTALEAMPKDTLIFDWQYFGSPIETSRKFIEKGFEVVGSPAILTYNALWCHVAESERNVRQHVDAINELGAHGVCVTTWECGLMGNYETLFSAIKACGGNLNSPIEPRQQPSAALKIKWEPGAVYYQPTPQEPDPNEGADLSISNGIVDSILLNALGRDVAKIELQVQADGTKILFDGESAGEFPVEQNDGIFRRLSLISNIDPLKKIGMHNGVLKGAVKEEPFTFDVLINLIPGSNRIELTNPLTSVHNQQSTAHTFQASYAQESPAHAEWARLMSDELQTLGGMFACGQIRSGLKCRLLLYSNPFLAWLHHAEELCGEAGDRALQILATAIAIAPTTSMRGVAEFGKLAIEFVRYAEASRQAYANGQPGVAAAELVPCRAIFDQLEKIAIASNINIGGSKADIERCRVAREHVEKVIRRIKEYGDGTLGYLPAYEIITHPKYMPHDQANWWLINRWANE